MISLDISDKTAKIKIASNLLIDDVEILEARVEEAYSQDATSFIFDFTNTDYMCSASLGVLAQLLKNTMEEGNGKVVFCSLSEKLKSVFDAMQFTSIVAVAKNIDEASEIIKN